MAKLGEELREAREKKGLTLEQIAETTRISHTFLKALEEDDYDVIPGTVFVTGFLRSYARELGLDEMHVLARYRELHAPRQEEAQPAAQAHEVQHKPKPALLRIRHKLPAKKSSLYLIILGGLLLGALLTGVTVLLTPKEQKPVAPPAAPVQAAAPKPAPTQPFKPASTAFKPVTTAAKAPTPAPPAALTVLKLKLTASADSSYVYRADGGHKVRDTLKKGGVMEITAKDSILLMLGNAGAVSGEYNGKALAPFGKLGVPTKNLLFTKDVAGEPTLPGAAAEKRAMPLRTSHKRR